MWQGHPPQQPVYYQPGPPQPGIVQNSYQPQFSAYTQNSYRVVYPTNQQSPNSINSQMPFASDPENPYNNAFEFDDDSIRRKFIRKVYSILTTQLLITFGLIAVFVFHEPTKLWVRENPQLFYIAFGIAIVTMLAMACCGSVRRTFPMNFVLLALFTLAESFLLGVLSSMYNPDLVMMAVGITAVVCFSLTLFAFQTKIDFTLMGGVLFVALIILFVLGLVVIFFPGRTLMLVYASMGAALFCIYLVYDTQLMIGGKHKYSISPEEYIFAALSLYLDVILIFQYILTLLGLTSE